MNNKKIILASIITLSSLALSGCGLLNSFLDEVDKYTQQANEPPAETFDVDKVDVDGKTIMQQTYKDYSDYNTYDIDYCPTKGNVKLLIIPVWFSDSSTYIKTANKETVREDIRKTYLGTNEETGWRSVKTYYEELSSGAVSISGTVTDWYSVSYSSRAVGYDGSITTDLVTAATNWYFKNNPSDNRSNYDSDNNGYIDAVMLIYGAPDYSALDDDSLENLWAYCYWLQDVNEGSYPIPNDFFWASYDFMYSKGTYYKPTPAGTEYGSGDTKHCTLDAHTYIHEMGHVFGLEDYYDYSSSKLAPAGGFSMQDYNVGSHDPYSVMALGWANPYVVTDNSTVTIGTFQKTKELIVVTENWNGIGSPFDEYLILELYSPTGLNALDCNYTYNNTIKGPSRVAVRIWHVDARLAYSDDVTTKYINGRNVNVPVYSDKNITNNAKISPSVAPYGVTHAFSNTYNDADYGSVLGSKYYNNNILQLIRNNTMLSQTKLKDTVEYGDLFGTGSYQMSSYKNQFVNSSPLTMNNGSFAGWNFRINISGSGNDATAKIEIVK